MSSVPAIPFLPERTRAFVARLADLSAVVWLGVGRSLAANRERRAARSTAMAILNATIVEGGLGMAAWYVRDAVETAAFLAGTTARRWSAADRRRLADARDAAEETALALLVGNDLTAKDFDTLCAPFVAHVPVVEDANVRSTSVERRDVGTVRRRGATA